MKKFVVILLSALLLIGLLPACGNTTDVTADGKKDPTSQNGGKVPNETPGVDTDLVPDGEITENEVRDYKTASGSDFEYTEIAGGVRITKYIGNDTIVVIPEQISGQDVIEISGYTFANGSAVRGVYVPAGVKKLGQVFINNRNIEVVICEGVEQLMMGVFTNCAKLHTVVLGDNLMAIGESAFGSCVSLKELYIAPSVTTIEGEWSVFSSCKELTIYGEEGSYIATFAAEHDIKFEAVEQHN